jgi:hypothetical protein
MSLKNLQLPVDVLADLYTNTLIEPLGQPGTKQEVKKEKVQKLSSLGGNARQISILVAEPTHSFMKDDELEWLQKMLQACKLTLGDVAIINTQSQSCSMAQVKQQLRPRKVLLLGPSPSDLQLPLNFPQFKIQEHDHCAYLYAPSAKELNQDTKEGKLLKSKLWVSLQQLFEV